MQNSRPGITKLGKIRKNYRRQMWNLCPDFLIVTRVMASKINTDPVMILINYIILLRAIVR